MARKRFLSPVAVKTLLAELTRAREACSTFRRDAPIHDPHFVAASEVMDAITRFATVATGDRDHFVPKPYSMTGPKG